MELHQDPSHQVCHERERLPGPISLNHLSEETPIEPQALTSEVADPLVPTNERGSSVPHSPHLSPQKLTLKKFNGDLTRWMTFWDTYVLAVHNNLVLTIIDKFSYVTSLLESTASEAVAGLTLMSANYEEAVSISIFKQRLVTNNRL